MLIRSLLLALALLAAGPSSHRGVARAAPVPAAEAPDTPTTASEQASVAEEPGTPAAASELALLSAAASELAPAAASDLAIESSAAAFELAPAVPSDLALSSAPASEPAPAAASELATESYKVCCGDMPYMGFKYSCLSTLDCASMRGRVVGSGLCGGC
jgi:hypothetical protein